jgi:hypothetical protein
MGDGPMWYELRRMLQAAETTLRWNKSCSTSRTANPTTVTTHGRPVSTLASQRSFGYSPAFLTRHPQVLLTRHPEVLRTRSAMPDTTYKCFSHALLLALAGDASTRVSHPQSFSYWSLAPSRGIISSAERTSQNLPACPYFLSLRGCYGSSRPPSFPTVVVCSNVCVVVL